MCVLGCDYKPLKQKGGSCPHRVRPTRKLKEEGQEDGKKNQKKLCVCELCTSIHMGMNRQ